MNYYYKYNFVSPESLYAIIREELKSYFDSGAVDDLLFPIWTEKCLKKLGKGSYKINQGILGIEDFQATLPENFFAVREAWLCTAIHDSYQKPNAEYQMITTAIDINNRDVYCDLCSDCATPDIIQAIYKVTSQVLFSYKRTYLLKPGNISTHKDCSVDCLNYQCDPQCPDSFDIRGNKFVVNFREGNVNIVYYVTDYDEEGYQMIPDSHEISEYIESFIKYKIFEQLYNQATDETFNQIERKFQIYNQMQAEAYIIAFTETKKPTAYQIQRSIRKTNNRLNKFIIP